MIIIGLTPSPSDPLSLSLSFSLARRPREIAWKSGLVCTCVYVVDFSGSTIVSRDDDSTRDVDTDRAGLAGRNAKRILSFSPFLSLSLPYSLSFLSVSRRCSGAI